MQSIPSLLYRFSDRLYQTNIPSSVYIQYGNSIDTLREIVALNSTCLHSTARATKFTSMSCRDRESNRIMQFQYKPRTHRITSGKYLPNKPTCRDSGATDRNAEEAPVGTYISFGNK